MNKKLKLSSLFILLSSLVSGISNAQPNVIHIQPDQRLHPDARILHGLCIEDVNHEIYGGIYSQMIFGESFQEPAPAATIKGFKSFGGSWIVRDGALHIQALDGPKLVSDYPAFKEGTVGVELFFAEKTGHSAGLVLRINDAAEGADRFIGYEVSLSAEKQSMHLARHRNNYEPISDVPVEVPIGKWIALEVAMTGTNLDIRVNGKSIMGVMMLAAGKGSKVLLETNGIDEQECFDAILALVNDKFGEGE